MQRGKIKLDDLLWLIQACMASIEEATRAHAHTFLGSCTKLCNKLLTATWKVDEALQGSFHKESFLCYFQVLFPQRTDMASTKYSGQFKEEIL